jgi:DNA-binding CsgD family transcriptional regulator
MEKKDWPAIEAAFHLRWHRKKAAKKAREKYEAEITSLGLKMEDLGKKETIAGREVYTHIVWADEMAAIVKGAKLSTTTTYIGHV